MGRQSCRHSHRRHWLSQPAASCMPRQRRKEKTSKSDTYHLMCKSLTAIDPTASVVQILPEQQLHKQGRGLSLVMVGVERGRLLVLGGTTRPSAPVTKANAHAKQQKTRGCSM